MAQALDAELRITAKNMTRAGLDGAARDVRRTAAGMERAMAGARRATRMEMAELGAEARTGAGRIDATMATAGRAIGAYLTFDALRRGVEAVSRSAYTVDQELSALGITAGATAEEIDRAFSRLTLAGTDVHQSGRTLVGVSNQLVAAGLALDDATGSAASASRLATAYGAEMRDVGNLTSALFTGFGANVGSVDRYFDAVATGSKRGQIEVKDLASGLGSLAGPAKLIGMDTLEGFQRLVAFAEVSRTTAGDNAEAINNARNALIKMIAPDVQKNFKKMGVDWQASMKAGARDGKDLLEVLRDAVMTATKGDLTKLTRLFPDQQAAAAVTALITGWENYKDILGEVRAETGVVARDAAAKVDTLSGSVDRLTAAWQNWLDVVSRRAAPTLKSAADAASSVLEVGATTLSVDGVATPRAQQLTGADPSLETLDAIAFTTATAKRLRLDAERTLKAVDDATILTAGPEAVRSGKMSLRDYEAIADPAQRRADQLDRQNTRDYIARGGAYTDADLAAAIAQAKSDRAGLVADTTAPAFGGSAGMVAAGAPEELARIDRTLTVLEGYVRARASKPEPPVGAEMIGGVPVPRARPSEGAATLGPRDAAPTPRERPRPSSTFPARPEPLGPGGFVRGAVGTMERREGSPFGGARYPAPEPRAESIFAVRPEPLGPGGFTRSEAAVSASLDRLAGMFDGAATRIGEATTAQGAFDPVTAPHDPRLLPPLQMREGEDGTFSAPRLKTTPMGSDAGEGARMVALLESLKAPGAITAVVKDPVKAEIQGRAQVDVRVQVDGGRVVGASSTSSGHIETNVGTSMPHVERPGGIGSR